jgi:hypothetical protein
MSSRSVRHLRLITMQKLNSSRYRAWLQPTMKANVTEPYAEALLVATPTTRLVDGKKPPKLTGVTPEQMAKMEREMSNLQGEIQT